jgi:hypothetical protein
MSPLLRLEAICIFHFEVNSTNTAGYEYCVLDDRAAINMIDFIRNSLDSFVVLSYNHQHFASQADLSTLLLHGICGRIHFMHPSYYTLEMWIDFVWNCDFRMEV